jgi:hypothetical protein
VPSVVKGSARSAGWDIALYMYVNRAIALIETYAIYSILLGSVVRSRQVCI